CVHYVPSISVRRLTLSYDHTFFFSMIHPPPISTLFPYTTLFRSRNDGRCGRFHRRRGAHEGRGRDRPLPRLRNRGRAPCRAGRRSEEHTSELQSLTNLVCRLLLEKKKIPANTTAPRYTTHKYTIT